MTWHDISNSLRANGGAISIAGVDLLVVTRDGEWLAIEDRCSHAGCSFSADGEIDEFVAICNCHGSEFDVRTGAPLAMPATQPIRTFRVRRSDSRIEVEV